MTRTPDQMAAGLRQIGPERYHILHPFHALLHSGGCTKDQVRAWALNRYCYQRIIPTKDATLLARLDDVEMRRGVVGRRMLAPSSAKSSADA
ncbi:MAG: hypothetical protein AAFS07_06740 [Pseudomonadota bacterium]